MKKLSFLAALLPLLFCACSSFIEENSAPIIPAISDLQAGFADETRTYVENGRYLRWHEDDRLTAFYGNTLNRQYKFKGKTGDNSGSFAHVPSGDLETGNAFDRIYALYPYNETTTITDEGEISLTLPALQSYAENSFGRGANTMIAVTENLEDTFLAFKNACGYLKLKLYNADGATIKSIEVKGNNGEKIAGAAMATIAFGEAPVLLMADDATDTITIDCGDGVSLGTTAETATEFWTVIPQTTFTKGITIKITDSQGGIFEKSTDNEVAITRNAIQPMAAVEFVKPQPNNEIWYTATEKIYDGGWDSYTFGSYVRVSSHTFDAETGKGVITFNGNVTKIPERAFTSYNLKSINIPESVTTIEEGAFDGAYNIETFNGKFAEDEGRILVSNGTLLAFAGGCGATEYTIPDGITTLGKDSFYNCDALKQITIGRDVTTINGAINDCSGLNDVIIPDNVTTLAYWAFGACNHLKSVTIGSGVTSVGRHAFAYCTELADVYIKAITPPTAISDYYGWNAFDFDAYNLKIYVPAESVDAYRRAEYWRNYDYAIVGYDFEAEEIVVPAKKPANNEIWYTGYLSLSESECLDSFGAKMTSNERNYATDRGVITFGGNVTKVGAEAFYNCSMTSITLPNSVTSIGDRAFYYCTNLKSITIPDGVTTFGVIPFYSCSRLVEFKGKYSADDGRCLIMDNTIIAYAEASGTTYTIPDSVTSIGDCAFYNCSNLTNVTIPDGVKSIGDSAFQACTSLTNVTIGNSVESIGEEAFFACTSLVEVNCKPINPPAGGRDMFSYYYYPQTKPIGCKIYVPRSSVSAYRYASYWTNYYSYIIGKEF